MQIRGLPRIRVNRAGGPRLALELATALPGWLPQETTMIARLSRRAAKPIHHSAILAFFLAMGIAEFAYADAPSLAINSPSGTVYVAQFPTLQQLNVTLSHNQLKSLSVLELFVNGVSLTGTIGNPFDNANACKYPNMSVTSSCNTNGLDQAVIAVPWTVSAPGSYVVTASVKHQGLEGEVTETVTFALVAVEYPAPPAIANAYISQTYGARGSARVRGCVINQIATYHAQFERYGPKGGPYDNPRVYADVTAFWRPCGGS